MVLFYYLCFSTFTGSDAVEIINKEVVLVNCGPGTHNHGSSKVKLTNVVDYQWQPKYYEGQLITIHILGKVLAYAIKGILALFG